MYPVSSSLGRLTAFQLELWALTDDTQKKLTAKGTDGYRALNLRRIADNALRSVSPENATLKLEKYVTVDGIIERIHDELPDFAPSVPRPRPSLFSDTLQPAIPRGRPPGPSVVVVVRVWTVECLCKLAGLKSVVAALKVWNSWYPDLCLKEATLESTGRRSFHRDRGVVEHELEKYHEARQPHPNPRGRPPKDSFARMLKSISPRPPKP